MIDYQYIKLKEEVMKNEQSNEVTVVDINMPFMSMVIFMVKWVLASIPALIILTVIFAFIAGILRSIAGVPVP